MPANERLLWAAALIALPLEPLAFYFVRVPLDDASLFALNFGKTRYERCPHCPALALDGVSRASHQ